MKNVIDPLVLLAAGDMSGNLTSTVLQTKYVDDVALQLDWTGSPVGTVVVEVSLNYSVNPDGSVRNAGTWAAIPSASFTGTYPVPGTSTSPGVLEVSLSAVTAMRVRYVFGSGTGALTIVAAAKGV